MASLKGQLRIEAVDFPEIPSNIHQVAIRDTIEKYSIDVVVIDPLYRGLSGIETTRMAEVGQAIVSFARHCRPAELILSHHTTKLASKEYGSPPELEDLTGAGIHESCGNWWLMGRNKKYEWDWQHDLCVQFGGRDEQAGGKRILFDEKAWTFEVESLHEYRTTVAKQAEKAKQDAKHDEIRAAKEKIKNLLSPDTPKAKSAIKETVGLSSRIFGPAFTELTDELAIESRPYKDSKNRNQTGWILKVAGD